MPIRTFLLALFFSLMTVSPLLADKKLTVDETLEAAYAAEEESRFQEVVDLLLPIVDKIPADSLQQISDACGTLAVSYHRLGDSEKAIKYGNLALIADEKSGKKENISSSLNNMAAFCLACQRLDEAESYLYRSLAIEKDLSRSDKMAIRLGLLSELYTQQGRLEEALTSAQEALDLDRKDGREEKVAIRLSQMGNTLMNMCRFQEAEPMLTEAVGLNRKHQNLPSLALSLISLCTTQRALHHIKEAETGLMECIEITGNIGFRQARLAAYMEMARLYNKAHDPRAFDYMSKFIALKDSLTDEQVQQQISDLKVSYETQEKEQEIALQEVTISRQRLLYIGLAILLLLAIVALFLVYRTSRLKEQNMRLKDRFMQLVSHDLKNPAIAQQRNLHGLLKCHQALEPEVMDEQLRQMAQAADAQVGLLYDLLDWAGLQTGRLKYDPIQLDLFSLTQKALDQHRAQANLKHITLNLQNEGEDHLVKADRQMVGTILRNVLSNALKFSPTESEIDITVEDHSVIVKDHGIGFDTTHLQQQTGTAGEEGTSLGLGLARKLAEINHAELEIASEKGLGTTVKLAFSAK